MKKLNCLMNTVALKREETDFEADDMSLVLLGFLDITYQYLVIILFWFNTAL